MTRVLLVEDDPTVRAVIGMLLETEPDFELVGVTGSAEEGVELVSSLGPDLVLLDNQLEGALTGLEAAPQMKAAHASTVVLLCTALDMQERAEREPAVDGYLRKEQLVDLVDVVRVLLSR
ncbi:MAG: LuxR family transcriptional regulator [Frankiales bacterium]|nr:LuxR family transcriptional regulator [Frankiales bacterium]